MNVQEKQEQLFAGLADLLERPLADIVPEFQPTWDSLAVVGTIALVDDVYDVVLGGPRIAKCEKVADLLTLIAEELR